MPTKLIVFILTLVIIVSFIGFNIENKSDITLFPVEKGVLHDVPIFLSFFVMYVIGVISVIPFFVSRQSKKKKGEKPVESASDGTPEPEKKKVRVLGSKKRKKKESESLSAEETGEADNTLEEDGKEEVKSEDTQD